MKKLHLSNRTKSDITCLSNLFIDEYMPEANGEYVKIYIYLLRCLSSGIQDISLSSIADKFNYTERDVERALNYWAKLSLMYIEKTEDQEITGISFGDVKDIQTKPVEPEPTKPAAKESSATAPKPSLSANRLKTLKDKKEIKQLLFIAEQYLGKTLSPTDTQLILYFYDELLLSVDLIEYLIEYCVSKGIKSMPYMKSVALAWAESSITTVAQAKETAGLYHKHTFSILKAFGIKGRNPGEAEMKYINQWVNDYDFTLELILEACNRTIAATHQPSFEYADTILKSWKTKGVRHLSDLDALDKQHKETQAKKLTTPAAPPKSGKQNKFNNFESRDYDFQQLEKKLLSNK